MKRWVCRIIALWAGCWAVLPAPAQSLYAPDKPVVVYDPATSNYLFYHAYDTRQTMPYRVMSSDEYHREQVSTALRNNWSQQRSSGNGPLGSTTGDNLIPSSLRFGIQGDAFGKIFGSNEIVINPQMSVDLSFGGKWNYSDNPLIAERYRTAFNFDFLAKMQFNITGNIGDRVRLAFNYNTEATFDFETNLKIEYAGGEDDILQKIEAGNVAFPLDGSLITGSQSLFGIKTDWRFGKLDVSTIVSNQRSESQTIELVGGGQSNVYEISADKYDANRHFFLAQYFRANYDKWLGTMPLILSGINIKRIEVWVTNKSGRFEETRDVVAFADLGESNGYPANSSNTLYGSVKEDIRDFSNVTAVLSGRGLTSGTDYEKLQNARKLLPSDYTVNAQLGYISLNAALNGDEVLAVAFEYEAFGRTYLVGELSTDGVVSPNALCVKLIKGTNFSPRMPTWQLMMKNVYDIGAYRINRDNFTLDIMYANDEAGTTLPYLPVSPIERTPLLRVLNLDNLNTQNDAMPDGMVDFVEGVTVLAEKGRIIFPVLEPFGSYLEKKIGSPELADQYVFKELYDSTLTKAQVFAEKNKFRLVGSYQSESGDEIRLNAMNIPQGSVVVTAGGTKLTEGVDYEVNYLLGSVRILNRAYLESSVPLKVSLESQEMFNMQTKTLLGTRLKYTFNKNFYVGGTLLHLSERPLTQKSNWGEEPISNTIWGLNTSFRTDVPWLTKVVDALPFLQTKANSSFSFDAEFAHFLPGHSTATGGSNAAFIDDFEGSQTSLDLRNQAAWSLASVPQGQPQLFPEGNLLQPGLQSGFGRAQLSWFYIYPDFVRNTSYTPGYMRADADRYQKNWYVCELHINDLFPEREEIIGTPTNIATLNVTYYPNERGPHNYDTEHLLPDGRFNNPSARWGGIQRPLPVTDFETANYDYIEFWLMDPFVYHPQAAGGKLYFNLGNISEDVLKDGLKSFENGHQAPDNADWYEETAWGRVPKDPQITLTFDNDYQKRLYQDIGNDGLNNEYERTFFSTYLDNLRSKLSPEAWQTQYNDPSGDDYIYYLDGRYDDAQADILDRYKYYNGTEGNSLPPEFTGGDNTMSTPNPDMEDMNRDYTMNETESYYQYEINLQPGELRVGSNYITSTRTISRSDFNGQKDVTFYQFKIPISEGKAVGGISDFKSIRFIRMFLKGFSDTTVLRMATFQLVRDEWRRYDQSLIDGQEGLAQPEMPNAVFDISAVNIEENSYRTPVNYVLPPGATRQIDPGQYQIRQLNEQAMELRVMNLADGDARAAYKNVTFDFRKYRHLMMDVHAEAIAGKPVRDNEVSLFVRLGNDYRYNYYEYEIPLVLTAPGMYTDDQREWVWAAANKLDIDLDMLTDAKLERNEYIRDYGGAVSAVYEKAHGRNRVRIMGNPNLGDVRTIMIGVRNPSKNKSALDDGLEKSADVWVNELRLTNFNETSGFAANARVAAKLADFGNISLSGNMMTPNFGGLESRIGDRSTDHVYQYDLITNVEFGLFFPKSIGVRLPLFFGLSENFTNPQYHPFDQDILYNDAMRGLSTYERDSIRRLAQDYTRRLSFNATNVRVFANAMNPAVFSLSNLSTGFSFSEIYAHNPRTDHKLDRAYHFNLSYEYNVESLYIDPLKSVPWLRSPWLQLVRDFNISPYPNRFAVYSDINRVYRETQFRSVVAPDIIIPPTASKDFLWDNTLVFEWNLMRSLKLNFDAVNRARIDEPSGIVNKNLDPEGYLHWRDSTWNNFRDFGRNIYYKQTLSAQWAVPINKIPLLAWTYANMQYAGDYIWEAAPLLASKEYDPGNTISNARAVVINGGLQFETLYNKIPFLRTINNETGKPAGTRKQEMVDKTYESERLRYTANRKRTIRHNLNTTDIRTKITAADGTEIQGTIEVIDQNTLSVALDRNENAVSVQVTGRVPKKENPLTLLGKSALRMAMMLRSVNITYNDNDGSTLPGFSPYSQYFGWGNTAGGWAPGWPFVLGWQDESFLDHARRQQWITGDTTLINPYMMTHTRTWSVRANLEPWPELEIILEGARSDALSNSWYNVSSGSHQRQASGNFSINVISIATAFERSNSANDYESRAFNKFLDLRRDISGQLAVRRSASGGAYNPQAINPITGYPEGYSGLSQEVLIPAFLEAYTGGSSKVLGGFPKIPLPKWQINYRGLSKINALKELITSFTLSTKYSSVYSLNSFVLNHQYEDGEEFRAIRYNELEYYDFVSQYDISVASIHEQFTPCYLNISWYNNLSTRFEWIKNRTLTLSTSNNQVMEHRSNDYIIGADYTFREVPLIFRFAQNNTRNVTTTLSLRADLSIKEDFTILRKFMLDETIAPQVSTGNYTFTIRTSADYSVSSNIRLRLFFDRVVNKPYVSAIGTANTNVGFSINLSL